MIDLRFLTGPLKGQTVAAYAGVTTVGRDRENNLRIDDAGIAPFQAEIVVWRDNAMLLDITGKRQTLVNNQFVHTALLCSGDRIQFGDTTIEVSQRVQPAAVHKWGEGFSAGSFCWTAAPSELIVPILTSVSHYVKNVLQSIYGGNRLIVDGIINRQMNLIENGWDIAQRNHEHLNQMLRDMLDLCTARESCLTDTDLNLIVRQALELIRQPAIDLGVAVHYELAEQMPLLQLDAEQFLRAVHSVLLIGLHSCPSGAELSVETFFSGNCHGEFQDVGDRQIAAVTVKTQPSSSPARRHHAPTETSENHLKHLAFALPAARYSILAMGGEFDVISLAPGEMKIRIAFPAEKL
jgi:hypothetical protein